MKGFLQIHQLYFNINLCFNLHIRTMMITTSNKSTHLIIMVQRINWQKLQLL